jgi:hypothetical protein
VLPRAGLSDFHGPWTAIAPIGSGGGGGSASASPGDVGGTSAGGGGGSVSAFPGDVGGTSAGGGSGGVSASGSVSAAVDPKEGGNGAAGVHPLMYTGALQTLLLAVVLAYYI